MKEFFKKLDMFGFYLAVILVVAMAITHMVTHAVDEYLTAQELAEKKYENR